MRPLTAAEVALLHGNPEVNAGLELLTSSLTVRQDISDDLVGGRVARALLNTIHGTCSLQITRELVWGVDLVRPYIVLADGASSARFNLGVYCLTTPERRVGETPETYEVQGQDRLYLLNRQVGATYQVTAGTTYRAALLAVFAAAGLAGVRIEGAAAGNTLPKTKTWPLVPDDQADPDQTSSPVTWLRIVNDLQQQWNGRGVYVDADGLFRCEAYRDPKTRPAEFTFDADTLDTLVEEDRTITEDVWAVPNRWVAIASNPPEGVTPSLGNGLIQERNNLTDGPTSQTARGLVWTSVLSYEAATSTALAGLVDRRVTEDRAVTTRYDMTVGPMPAAGHGDVYRYVDSAAGEDRRVQLMALDLDLTTAIAAMTWEAV